MTNEYIVTAPLISFPSSCDKMERSIENLASLAIVIAMSMEISMGMPTTATWHNQSTDNEDGGFTTETTELIQKQYSPWNAITYLLTFAIVCVIIFFGIYVIVDLRGECQKPIPVR